MIPLGHAGRRHRRFRLGKIHAGSRRALQGPGSQAHRRQLAANSATGSKAMQLSAAVEMVDQSPIGRTPRSNPSTYLKAFDAIREVFAVDAGSQKARLRAGPFLVQHSRRPLRGLPGRRHRHGGDAVSRRRRAGLRRVPRHALQEQRPGSALSATKTFTTCCS